MYALKIQAVRADMSGVAIFAVLLAALVSPSQENAIGNATCELQFQEHINAAIAVKRECESAALTDCCQLKVLIGETKTDIYTIEDPCRKYSSFAPKFHGIAYARCYMDSGDGGWLVIQRRVKNGTVDFDRGWSDYEDGFGDLKSEFWYGLKNIHCLTSKADVELRVNLEDEEGSKITRTYQEFKVEGPENKYQLHIGNGDTPTGTRDFMATHNNRYFTTNDIDNDRWYGSCAQKHRGGWWWDCCGHTNPNGLHHSSTASSRISVNVGSSWIYYPHYEMKIRPKSCSFLSSESCT